MKQPDAFDQLTHMPESWHEVQSMDSTEEWAAHLLRRYHARVVRLVKRSVKP